MREKMTDQMRAMAEKEIARLEKVVDKKTDEVSAARAELAKAQSILRMLGDVKPVPSRDQMASAIDGILSQSPKPLPLRKIHAALEDFGFRVKSTTLIAAIQALASDNSWGHVGSGRGGKWFKERTAVTA